jgi:DNA invertase Pin-like site-specific DNA recombinase
MAGGVGELRVVFVFGISVSLVGTATVEGPGKERLNDCHFFLLRARRTSLDFRPTRATVSAMKTVAYLRVAPGCDDLDAQQQAVMGWVQANALAITAIYRDGPRRGSAGRSALLREVAAGRVRQVIVARPCRLAPTLPSLLALLRRLHEAGVSVVAANSPEGFANLLIGLDALVAVRAGLHQEAVAAGREQARRHGTRLGRPPVAKERVQRVRSALLGGASLRQAARAAGVGVATAARIKAAFLDTEWRETAIR